MREELDKQLVEKYPHMFQNRYKGMHETCMCWGFECGDGWYQILDSLCSNIEHHVKWKRDNRARDHKRNRAIKRGREALTYFICKDRVPSMWDEERIEELLAQGYQEPTQKVHRVVVDQVKEKFGGLRFYYRGGDDVVDGMVRMAESWAARTCETCGNPGTLRHGGWVRTLCDQHEAEYQERQKKMRSEDDDE